MSNKKARIYVGGSLVGQPDSCRDFVRHLGRQIIDRGHILLTGCSSDLDRVVAEAAVEKAAEVGTDPSSSILSYLSPNAPPAHHLGTVLGSDLPDWNLGHGTRARAPEPISQSDVVILIGGDHGTRMASQWAEIEKKPVLGIPTFGGAAREAYQTSLESFNKTLGKNISRDEFAILKLVTTDMDRFAAEVISLAKRVISPRDVFLIMSYDKPLEDLRDTFEEVCRNYKFRPIPKESPSGKRIITHIMESISHSAFVIADLSEPSPNVFYELGYAVGLGVPQIVTAREGAERPFDVFDMSTIIWRSQKDLKEKLAHRVEAEASKVAR